MLKGILGLLSCGAMLVIAQTNIKIAVNEVIVPVTVTDDKDRFVSDLDKNDFEIFDEGKRQRISYFSRERNQPVVVGFLLDLSNASRLHWKTYQEAARELVWNLLPGDSKYSGYLIGYHTEAELMVNTTKDADKITDKIAKLKPSGGAALFDSIYMACTKRSLIKGEPIEPRRVLIIVGDGHDNASKKTMDEVLELAQRNLVTIYGISTVAFGFNSEGEKILTKLAEDTGGRVLYPLQGLYKDVSGYLSTPSDEGNYALKVGTGGYAAEIASGIFRSIAAVAGEVTTQYIIRYVPESDDSKKVFRNIHVKVPSLPGVKIRARKGYYPANP
ncbi:MAG: VWA domain-containing protein [Candidatus Solibacter usitatus]|nr:VWA domain-containing protein [Candidatus Solibacter usitatus]